MAQKLDLTNRISLMGSLPRGGTGAEIGVADGIFSHQLLEECKPKLLYLIDPWQYQSKEALRSDASNVSQEAQDSRYKQVCNSLGKDPRIRILRDYSLVAVNTFVDEYFDWWHLDGDHTQVRKDIDSWWPKLKRGGWATGHDYTVALPHITVKTEVDKFVTENGLELHVTQGNCGNIYEKNYPTWAVRKP